MGVSRPDDADLVCAWGLDVKQVYHELQIATNYSFLRGASHPSEYIWRAAELGYSAIGITDYNTLAGVVKAHAAAKEAGIKLCVGCRLELDFKTPISKERHTEHLKTSVLVYPTSATSYAALCKLITTAKSDLGKNNFQLELSQFLPHQHHFATVAIPPGFQTQLHTLNYPDQHNTRMAIFYEFCKILRENSKDPELLSIALTYNYGSLNRNYISAALQISRSLSIAPIVTNDVHYHTPERKPLHDTLTAIRLGVTVERAGYHLYQNSERYLKSPNEIRRLFREHPQAISRTQDLAQQALGFSLSDLKYTYPREVVQDQLTPTDYLRQETLRGAETRFPNGIPERVTDLIESELALIKELAYEKYFLTCYEIVSFARKRGILCQGRGAAANSAVCYCLGITAVNPTEIDLLFARFVSKERQEPPDIDIDFEHERREEVIQFIYSRFGRERAALTAEVVTFQARSAVREVGKALGLSLEVVDILSRNIHSWTDYTINSETLREIGLNPFDPTILNVISLASELVGFPRHLSQHVGGFIISDTPLNEIVPIINAGMPGRTIIEWDKNDIEELGMLKIDILALGMLTCIRKALALINQRLKQPLQLYTIPADDPKVYQMLRASDTLGVFQVESRAQMAMLPRLKPNCFYDLVIQVAIVRPGPIQGNMVHPFLRRRAGLERVSFPDKRVESILGKTLGVPIFQEQAMRLAITLANFTPGEAEKLRRAMAAWKSHKGVIETFKEKITRGMLANGYTAEFAENCLNQIKGFSEYGFPESHAASFAHLVYASAWIKRHYPAEFACALLNSQPMGFYEPAQIIRDAQRHGVRVEPIDVNLSKWDCSVERKNDSDLATLRLGLRMISGVRRAFAEEMESSRASSQNPKSPRDIWLLTKGASRANLNSLARADAFSGTMGLSRAQALWEIQELSNSPAPLDRYLIPRSTGTNSFIRSATEQQEMFKDYASTGVSLRAHPIQYLREQLSARSVVTAESLQARYGVAVGRQVSVAGLTIIKQRPGTAKGVVFITLEDETNSVNLVIRPKLFELQHRVITLSAALLVTGKLERIGNLVYIDVNSVSSLDTALAASSKAS